jgi:uncharacterized protein YqjF (DUF2071 family)
MSETPWVFRMRWVDLLFAHWPVPVEALRPLIPRTLEIDTFEGQAWLGVVPFRMEDVAPRFLPAPPGPGAFPELNVRTYVTRGGRGGVWFLSLDAGSRLAVEAARAAFHLPYYRAHMSADTDAGWVDYRSERTDPRGAAAIFDGRYRPTGPVALAPAGSLEAFLTDRFGLYAADPDGRISWTAIRHEPWPLQPAEAEIRVNTMAAAHGLMLPAVPPVLHFAKRLDVQAWWPRPIRTVTAQPPRPVLSGHASDSDL